MEKNSQPRLEHSVDHLIGQELRSESVGMHCSNDDWSFGFQARPCRYPTASTTWYWLRLVINGRMLSYNHNHLSCSSTEIRVDTDHVIYDLDNPPTRFVRNGPLGLIESSQLETTVIAHETGHAPSGEGAFPLTIEARFSPAHPPESRHKGRTEVFGTMHGHVLAG